MIILGDCREKLKELPSGSVRCCVTSPPYYGLRDYGVDGQIGLEQTPEDFVQQMVEVFRGVRRVLTDDGTLWLNLGDSYAAGGKGGGGSYMNERRDGSWHHRSEVNGWRGPPSGLKQKDLIGIPWLVAFALRADGWYLRSDIIWHKPNPMPESVTDRPTKSHEYIFLLSKSEHYFYNQNAIKEPLSESSIARLSQDVDAQKGSERANGGAKTNGVMKAVGPRFGGNKYGDMNEELHRTKSGNEWTGGDGMRNKRSVWMIATVGFKEAHFATFPPKLIEPCILAGSEEGDTILDPFNGAGTTGLVALQNGRQYIGIELNPEYIDITNRRLAVIQPIMQL